MKKKTKAKNRKRKTGVSLDGWVEGMDLFPNEN